MPKAVAGVLRHREDDVHRIERELDLGLGACWLGRSEIAALVETALLHFDGQRYRTLAWRLMPNHVHVVVEMMDSQSLSDIVASWKSFTAHKANALLERNGRFWHADYFDRFMRNEEHLNQTIEYVEQNPVKAGMAARASDWAWSSARFRKI